MEKGMMGCVCCFVSMCVPVCFYLCGCTLGLLLFTKSHLNTLLRSRCQHLVSMRQGSFYAVYTLCNHFISRVLVNTNSQFCHAANRGALTQYKKHSQKTIQLPWYSNTCYKNDKPKLPFDAIITVVLTRWFQHSRNRCTPGIRTCYVVYALHKNDSQQLLCGQKQYVRH